MRETDGFASITERAERERIAPSSVTRVLRLTPLAPEIVEAILERRQPERMTLARVLEPFPVAWRRQPAEDDHGVR